MAEASWLSVGGIALASLTTDMALRLDRSLEQQRHQFDARRVHRFSKMLLRDLKKFANFVSALGISSFLHRKIGTLQSY
ncbi:MAG: hypothetical protein KIG57_05350 [Muribaculaceae bacterium]|nr:hypothetical protein [Muribaculaceae bacterium]